MNPCVQLIVLWVALTACVGAAGVIIIVLGLDVQRVIIGTLTLMAMWCVLNVASHEKKIANTANNT